MAQEVVYWLTGYKHHWFQKTLNHDWVETELEVSVANELLNTTLHDFRRLPPPSLTTTLCLFIWLPLYLFSGLV